MLSNFHFLVYECHRFTNVLENLPNAVLGEYAVGIKTRDPCQDFDQMLVYNWTAVRKFAPA